MNRKRSTKSCSIAEARNALPALIHEVEEGATIEITRRGQPVAAVVSIKELERVRGEHASFRDLYSAWRRTVELEEDGLEPDFFSALRDRSPGRDVKL